MPPDDPEPAPVTTIAWRLAHVIVEVLAMRTASHFGGPPADYDELGTTPPPPRRRSPSSTSSTTRGRPGWPRSDEEGLARSCGEAEGPFAAYPLAALVLHINREMIHHGAEICLLRDLYLRHEESA